MNYKELALAVFAGILSAIIYDKIKESAKGCKCSTI